MAWFVHNGQRCVRIIDKSLVDDWAITSSKRDPRRVVNELCALFSREFDSSIPENHALALASVGCDPASANIMHALPETAFMEYVSRIVADAQCALHDLDTCYYTKYFVRTKAILCALERALIDADRLRSHAEREVNPTMRKALLSFTPLRDGLADDIAYDRFSSRTGRLVVSSGPRILTLRKQHKDIISARAGGRVVSFDYASFESRVALALAGKTCRQNDLYDMLGGELFAGEVSRNIAKQVILSTLFGMSTSRIAEKLGVSEKMGMRIARRIENYFSIKRITTKIRSSIVDGTIKNAYGRVIKVPSTKNNVLYNSFVQSTAVDAALMGFGQMIGALRKNDCKPLFVLHDALIVDAPDSANLAEISQSASSLPLLKGFFPVTIV